MINNEDEKYIIALHKFDIMLYSVLNNEDNYTEEDFIELEIINKYALNIIRQYDRFSKKDVFITFNKKYNRLINILNKNDNLNIVSYQDMEKIKLKI